MSELTDLHNYIIGHSVRSSCVCGKCIDVGDNPPEFTVLSSEEQSTDRHTADVVFFKVQTTNNADAGELRRLIEGVQHGEFCDVNLFDGSEHNYLELGGWIGDQGQALVLMGMGYVLGLWDLLTPRSLFPPNLIDDDMVRQMAGSGLITIRHKKAEQENEQVGQGREGESGTP